MRDSRPVFVPTFFAGSLAGLLALAGACSASGEADGRASSGHVEATEVRVAAKVGGRIVALPLDEGDAVQPGQVIAEIDTTDQQLALATARAERAGLAAEVRLKRTGARPEDVREAEAQVAQVRADLAGAERDLARMQALLDSGSGTEKSRDDARTRREALTARLAAAEQALTRLRHGFRAEEIDAAEARLAAADARIAQLEQQVADAKVVAPAAGVVTEKPSEQGELVAPGTLLVVVTQLSEPWLTVYVDERQLGAIRIGQVVDVVTDAGERRQGRVSYIASRAEFTPKNVQTRDERAKLVFKVKLALPNADGLFKPGMPAEAHFTQRTAPNGPAK